MEATALQEEPAFVLAVSPHQMAAQREQLAIHTVVPTLKAPPQVRNFGFDLEVGGKPEQTTRSLRLVTQGYKALALWEDGTLVFVATGSEEFLCWGRSRSDTGLRINPGALVEATFLFAQLSRQIYAELKPVSKSVQYWIELRSMSPAGVPPALRADQPTARRGKSGWSVYTAPDAGAGFSVRHPRDANAGAIAFSLVASVYAWFGIDSSKVPYSERAHGIAGVIAPDRIKW